ncbi:MAG: hypothetical protein HC929_16595 [Leptolyngbyaceae cyanobacterium SM2_5_2]|nr:hypothetical protein [Leptolyngbyaceae cyanobacterium SM2_5_2]
MTMNRGLTSLLSLVLVGLVACDNRSTPASLPNNDSPPDNPDSPVAGVTPQPSVPEAPAPPAQNDYTIIPGQRVGQVTSTTSRQQLADLYGEASLKDEPIPMGEGFTEPGTIVDLDPEHRFAVVWLDAERSRPLLAKDFGSAWKTPEGLGVGVAYAMVQEVLGTFQLYGFAWDYSGSLSLEGSKLDHYYGNLLLRVEPSEASVAAHPEAFRAVLGDGLFAGDDPNLALLDISVYEMVVYLNAPVE